MRAQGKGGREDVPSESDVEDEDVGSSRVKRRRVDEDVHM